MAPDRDGEIPDPEYPQIVVDDRFGGEPRLRGRRITVLNVYNRVRAEEGGFSPAAFADRFDVPVADVYAALAYHVANQDEMDRHRRERTRSSEALREIIARERPPGVDPPDG